MAVRRSSSGRRRNRLLRSLTAAAMSSHLIESLATTTELADVFSDRSLLQAMLDFEIALAQAEAAVGLIPRDAAAAIASSTIDSLDAAEIGRSARSTGTVSIGFVTALATQVRSRDPKSADFVHFGATSQDVADTAMALTLRRAMAILAAEHARLDGALRQLSDAHARTIMLGRTLLQPAPPITFGLKVAGWVAALSRGWRRVDAAAADAIALQFGGAVGTLAALGRARPAGGAAAGPASGFAGGGPVAYPPRSPGRIRLRERRLRRDARQGRARCFAADAARGCRGRRARRRFLDHAAQAQSGGERGRARGSESHSRPGGGVPRRHGAGTRAVRRRLACRVADCRSHRASDGIGPGGTRRRCERPVSRRQADARQHRSDQRH